MSWIQELLRGDFQSARSNTGGFQRRDTCLTGAVQLQLFSAYDLWGAGFGLLCNFAEETMPCSRKAR